MAPAMVAGPPAEHATKLRELYGEPPGRFLQGAAGITHFVLDEPPTASSRRARIAVLSHGIGTSGKVFSEFVDPLLKAGFRVLRYDFHGHGWSNASQACEIDLDILLRQLQELLDQALTPGEGVDLFVGHSTGALLGIKAAVELPSLPGGRRISQLALISPAFWKVAPLIVKLTDKVPAIARWLAGIDALKLIANGYLENCDNAFAHEGTTYMYPQKHEAAKADIKKMFSLHPQVRDAITGFLTRILREDLLTEYLPSFQALVASKDTKIGLFWGTHDIVVEFKHAQEVLAWPGGDAVDLVELKGMGHEAPQEDPVLVASEIAKWAGPAASRL